MTNANTSTGALSSDQVENYWIQAGGNPQAASMAAAVADASSGFNPNAQRTNPDGTVSVGLWLIPQNGTPPGSTDPVANARAAIQLSSGGTDWSQWCVTWSDNNCGLNGGTYLGEGSNALGSLASGGNSFSVAGAAPTGTGTGASSAPATTPTATSSSSKSLITIAVLLGMVGFVFFMVKRKSGSGTGSEGSSWSSDETSALQGEGSDTELASKLGRSRHAIHVKRSRMKSDSDYTH